MLKKTVFLILILCIIGGCWLFFRSGYKPRVFDCFLFYNEFDVLDVRLDELADQVEKFILVESSRTFQNNPKPLYFAENKERYAKYKDKIVHVVVDQFPPFSPVGEKDFWEAEIYQRDRIKVGLNACHPRKRDIVIFTDADEIIKKEKIHEIVKLIDQENNDIVFGNFVQYGHFFNRKIKDEWDICIATSWENFSKYIKSGEDFRALSGFSKGHAFNAFIVLEKIKKKYPHKKWAFARTVDTGWHFTTIGGYEKALQKLYSQSHIECNTEANRDFDVLRNQIMNSMELCEIDSSFPKFIVDNQDKFRAKNLIDEKVTVFR
jgi:beta-1,4-mannosyl-glycoprotein beta-1,4-N-acetylglucosaminyltransferase